MQMLEIEAIINDGTLNNIEGFQITYRVVSDETQNVLMKTLELTKSIVISGRQIHDANTIINDVGQRC